MSTEALLNDRGTTHGSFADNAYYGQVLRCLFRESSHWRSMRAEHREALDMIACKLSRIMSGQATFLDHWLDLAGYATLAAKACEQPQDTAAPNSPRRRASEK